ncbi:MAG: DUF222 domain-containing protein [Actinomycetota bacterium]
MDVREVSERAACLPLERLEAEITTQAGHLAAAECRWLLFVAEYDRREGWGQWGCWSCAMWLGWKCGLARRSAQEKVRVARALGDLPLITEAFSRGELSYSQVRALTRVAEPATEAGLLEIARNGTAAQLERMVRGMRTCIRRDDETEEANVRHERRYVSYRCDDDGSLVGSFRVDPEEAPTVVGALEAVEKVRSAERPAVEDPETERADKPVGARRADAFVAIMENALAGDAKERCGGDRYLTVVHIDAETLVADADGRCQVENGPALAPETVRRLACDSGLVTMLDDPDGNPLVVGKKSRTIPPALRRAVQARDECCKFPGCGRPIAHIHHIEFWAQGGPTVLTNLIGVCKFHHRCVHEGGYTIKLAEDGSPLFHRPDGQLIDPVPKAATDPDDGGIERRNRDHGLTITDTTVTTNWCGDGLDLSLATDNVMWDRRRAKELDLDAAEEPSDEVWTPTRE